jgi:C4-dicarboxylate-specific signal transduction histidine kinase
LVRTFTTRNTQEINEIFLLDKNGWEIASTNKSQEGSNKKNDPFFTQAKNEAFLKDIYFSPVTKKVAYSVSAPIKDDQTGKLLGVVVIRYNLDQLLTFLSNQVGLGNTGETF